MNNEEKDDSYWQKKLSPMQYKVLRQAGTEPPFTGELCENKQHGTYSCGGCGVELFDSKQKFDSGSGWPSFFDALDNSQIKMVADESLGGMRVEILCGKCGGHLGHIFDDGPEPTGKRYCVNSASLNFSRR